LTADTHLNHGNMLVGESSFGTRHFDSVEEMNKALISAWNGVVSVGDRVYHLGDILFSHAADTPQDRLISQLNGQIYLLRGNHDRTDDWSDDLKKQFVFIRDRHELRVDGYRPNGTHLYVALSHYPMRTWNRRFYGALHAYGHVHSKLDGGEKYDFYSANLGDHTITAATSDVSLPGSMDVGVDNAKRILGKYRPFHIDEFLDIIGSSQYWDFLDSIKPQENAEMILSSQRLSKREQS
jgi:calcineurin-like phosphoesterase family protein